MANGDTTGWLQLVLAAAGGFATALIGAFTAAWSLSGQLRVIEREMVERDAQQREYFNKELRDTRHTLYGRIDMAQMGVMEKIEEETQKLETRLREVERAVDRMPPRTTSH
jgi:hypothetical protein